MLRNARGARSLMTCLCFGAMCVAGGLAACGSDLAPSSGAAGAAAAGADEESTAGADNETGGAAGAANQTGGSDAGAGDVDGEGPPMSHTDAVLERNNHASRDGSFLQPLITKSKVPGFASDTTFAAHFEGNMWASPLYLDDGPDHEGVFFAVTTGNDVVALDETTGALVWTKNIGPSPTATGVPCGKIHPLGILSTPVIDAATRTIYVAGAIGTSSIAKHEIHALSVDDGAERAGFPIDVTGMKSDEQTFVAPPENQRGALALVGGILYVAYGGHIGDCGAYHGWVISVDTKDPRKRGAWATRGQGEGIWAAGGLASDGQSIFAVTGNSTVGAPNRDVSDSEQVVRLTGLSAFRRAPQNLFYPKTWQAMDERDADFAASSPVYLSVPGSKPTNYLAATAKDGHLYLLDASNLGGSGDPVVDFQLASGAKAVHTTPASYVSAKGVHYVLSTYGANACPKGGASGKVVLSVLIEPGSPPVPRIEWCAPISGSMTGPVATTSNGTANAVVWYVNNNRLAAVDGDTGAPLFTSSDACDGVREWTSPIAVKGRIVVGADTHLCSWSAH